MLSVTSSQTFCSVMQSAATAVERSVMLSGACIANRSSAATNALRLLVLVDVDDAMILISMKCLFVLAAKVKAMAGPDDVPSSLRARYR